VVTAFCMKDILHLRIVGVASNVAFLTYGIAFGLMPVWLLHLVLLPVNLVRLWQIIRRTASTASRVHRNARLFVRRSLPRAMFARKEPVISAPPQSGRRRYFSAAAGTGRGRATHRSRRTP